MISRGAFGLPPYTVVDSNGHSYTFEHVTDAHTKVVELYGVGVTAAVYGGHGQMIESSDIDGVLAQPADGDAA